MGTAFAWFGTAYGRVIQARSVASAQSRHWSRILADTDSPGGPLRKRHDASHEIGPQGARNMSFPRYLMLLCLSRGSDDISVAAVLGLRVVFRPEYCWVADKTGMGRSMWSAQALIRSRPAGQVGPGTADESFEGQQGSRQPIIGSGRPRSFRALAGGRAEVAVDLAGDVALEAADDLRLGLSFCRAALGVGACGRVRAQAGEHDPP